MHGINIVRLCRYQHKVLFQGEKLRQFFSTVPKNKLRNVLKLHERGMFDEIFPDTSV
jgi:hypothetical protein